MNHTPRFQVWMGTLPSTGDKVLLTVTEACEALSIKRTLLYAFLSTGELGSVKVRGRRLIPKKALDGFVDHLIEQGLRGS
jgi:excisionase family DNA binding protein